jgi:hypothetical protein
VTSSSHVLFAVPGSSSIPAHSSNCANSNICRTVVHRRGDKNITIEGSTYDKVDATIAVDFVCYIERAASSLGDGNFACLCGFEVPDGVLILRVLEQLVGCHGSGYHCQGSLRVLKRIPIRAIGSCASTVHSRLSNGEMGTRGQWMAHEARVAVPLDKVSMV